VNLFVAFNFVDSNYMVDFAISNGDASSNGDICLDGFAVHIGLGFIDCKIKLIAIYKIIYDEKYRLPLIH